MKTLSFIIPAYNSQAFLEKCVSSMLVESVRQDLEILIVNDGSTDGTAAECERLRGLYPDVITVLNQENRGHGGALNTGCAAARGRYLKVIDADDWICSGNLPAFVEHLRHCESDVVLTHHHTVDIQTGRIESWKSYPRDFEGSVSLETVVQNWRDYERSMRFHGITYRTAFYRQHSPGLPERVFYEDNFYATYPCCHAQTIEPLDLYLYEYRIGDVHQSVSEANQIRRIDQMAAVLRAMAEERCRITRPDGAAYADKKTGELLMNYLSLALLLYPQRSAGRRMAREIMALFRRQPSAVYNAAVQKYRVFCLFNRLHLGKNRVDALFASALYRKLRGHRALTD